MADTLPMLERDPRHDYRTSRVLRILAFSFFTSALLVSILIVVFRFIWDNYVSQFFGGGAYNAQPLLIVPAIVVITAILGKMLWDLSEGRVAKPKLRTR